MALRCSDFDAKDTEHIFLSFKLAFDFSSGVCSETCRSLEIIVLFSCTDKSVRFKVSEMQFEENHILFAYALLHQ